MLERVGSFFDFFGLGEGDRAYALRLAGVAADRAREMMDLKDYEALAAIMLYSKPRIIFEIGTYLGVTSDFFLDLLPTCRVVSIAYPERRWWYLGKRYNNTELSRKQIGSAVKPESRARFTQLYGNSHQLQANRLVDEFGRFDIVFIDGDHTRDGVLEDTRLAREVISESGVICWHDANPKPKYRAVREFLEAELQLNAIATRDTYIGGIACWSGEVERKLGRSK